MKKSKTAFWISFSSSLGLIIGGFFVPPTGIIDGSILTATGELAAYAALAELPSLFNQKGNVKIKKGDTEITVHNHNKDNEEL